MRERDRIFTSPSAAHVTIVRSSVYGMKRAWKTLSVWPEWNDDLTSPASQSHSIIILSSDPDTRMFPSALKLIVLTQPLCLSSLLRIFKRRIRSCSGKIG